MSWLTETFGAFTNSIKGQVDTVVKSQVDRLINRTSPNPKSNVVSPAVAGTPVPLPQSIVATPPPRFDTPSPNLQAVAGEGIFEGKNLVIIGVAVALIVIVLVLGRK